MGSPSTAHCGENTDRAAGADHRPVIVVDRTVLLSRER
jgi:hypothetical protein